MKKQNNSRCIPHSIMEEIIPKFVRNSVIPAAEERQAVTRRILKSWGVK